MADRIENFDNGEKELQRLDESIMNELECLIRHTDLEIRPEQIRKRRRFRLTHFPILRSSARFFRLP